MWANQLDCSVWSTYTVVQVSVWCSPATVIMVCYTAPERGHVAGKFLSQGVRDIYDEFVATMEKWHHIEYGIIDIGASAFSADYDSFRAIMSDLDRRLCQVVLTAFDDCATMTATFKLLDSFEGLLDREVISQVCNHINYRVDVRILSFKPVSMQDCSRLHAVILRQFLRAILLHSCQESI
jgi:Dynein heavy chain, N-terminal region 1